MRMIRQTGFVISSLIAFSAVALEQDSNDIDPEEQKRLEKLLNKMYPISPEGQELLIQRRHKVERHVRGAIKPPKVLPATVVPVDPTIGSQPPIVYLNKGFSASIEFRDMAGRPWRINTAFLDEENFQYGRPEGQDNILILQPTKQFVNGNAIVLLEDFNDPIPLQLQYAEDKVHLVYKFQIQAASPAYKPITSEQSAQNEIFASSEDMLRFLNLLPPSHAVELNLSGPESHRLKAWKIAEFLYVRSRDGVSVSSPAYLEKNTDGNITVVKLRYLPNIRVYSDAGLSRVLIDGEKTNER